MVLVPNTKNMATHIYAHIMYYAHMYIHELVFESIYKSCLIKTKVENNLKDPLIERIEVWRCGLVF